MKKIKPTSGIGAAQHAALLGTGPTRYRIMVGKWLSPSWSHRLAEMHIEPAAPEASPTGVSRLEGSLQDQAQLSGVLNTLYEMGLALLSVIESEPRRQTRLKLEIIVCVVASKAKTLLLPAPMLRWLLIFSTIANPRHRSIRGASNATTHRAWRAGYSFAGSCRMRQCATGLPQTDHSCP